VAIASVRVVADIALKVFVQSRCFSDFGDIRWF